MQERKQNNQVSASATLRPILCGYGITGGVCEMTMEQYLSHVRSQFYRAQVDGMRRETDPTRRGMLKKKLFWILPQGGIKPGHRQVLGTQPTKEDIEYRDLQMLDLDTLPEGCATPADAWYHMRHRLHDQGLAHYPMVVMESASGGGLHIYVRLSERMTHMNRREVIALWGDILGVEFDPAVTDPARRAFQSYNLFSAEEEIALLFGAELTDKQREAMEEIENSKLKIESSSQDDNIAGRGNIAVPNSEFRINNSELAAIAQRLVTNLCGTTTPPEGTRNTTLYEAAKQMTYLEGITEEEITEAFRPMAFLGLPETEARSCIRSALKREKTWLYTLPPELARAMEEMESFNPVTLNTVKSLAKCPGINGLQSPCAGSFVPQDDNIAGSLQPEENNSQFSIFNFQFNSATPELVSLFTSLVPEHTREAAASMIFAPLGSYLSNTVTIDDVSGQERNLQFTSIVVGNSSSGKGFAGTLSDLITERHRQHDIGSWAQLTAWQEQKRTTPKGEAAPPKPDVPLYLLASNMTEPALLERLKALEPHHGRAYINVPEIDDLRKMQTVSTSRIGAGQEIILSAFDTARYGALRVSAEAVSTITVMSLNIVATSTYPGTQDFFRGGIERGSVGRCDISIVPDCYDVPHYGRPTPELYAQLDSYIDRLQQATGHIQCDDIDRVIEEIRLAYNDPRSPLSHYQNAEYYKLCHRQLLITKQKATILYICNDYQWDPTWEPWLHHTFYYGMECKISVFKSEIESWIKRQYASLTATVITRSGPKSELDNLPQTFTLDDIVAMKRTTSPTDTDEQLTTKAKTLIRTWKLRQRIIPTEQEGVWEKVES